MTRSELEMECILQKYKVIARKQQIQIQLLDNEYPLQPFSLSTYTEPKRRREFIKILTLFIRQFLP